MMSPLSRNKHWKAINHILSQNTKPLADPGITQSDLMIVFDASTRSASVSSYRKSRANSVRIRQSSVSKA